MISADEQNSLIESIDACMHVEDLLVPMRALCGHLGFDHFLMGVRTPILNKQPAFLTLSGLPSAWIKVYDEKKLITHDPILQRARTSVRPFAWDELDWGGSAESRLMREEINAREIGHGFTISLRGPVLQSGIMNFSRRISLPADPYERRILFDSSRVPVLHIFDRVIELVGPQLESPRDFRLTAKELEFLRLSALGLPLKKINDLMNIKQSTATYFTNRIVAKIGVRRIREAVIQAQMNGLIDLVAFPEKVHGSSGWIGEPDQ